ncbi:MAG: MgtC/SapB family protein [Bdellovibrionales bacterium]
MSISFINALTEYWTPQEIATNVGAIFNIFIALLLGLLVGYERSYRGRAAGMRTYGLVCMSSCAFVVLSAHPETWFGGRSLETLKYVDPSRIIQGITTGIGFLGAGVIMRDGLSISGLTTAASIWTVSAIGVLVGIGFYGAAITLSLLAAIFMMWGAKIEDYLPVRHALSVTLLFHKQVELTETEVFQLIRSYGYEVARGSFSINQTSGQIEWRFVVVSQGKRKGATLVKLSEGLRKTAGIQDFKVSHARN